MRASDVTRLFTMQPEWNALACLLADLNLEFYLLVKFNKVRRRNRIENYAQTNDL